MEIVVFLVYCFYTYLAAGLLFGFWFVFKGVQKMDKGMKGAKWTLRLILLPGTMALWPLLLQKFLKT